MSNSVYSTQIQKLKNIEASTSKLSSRVKELKSEAEKTWFIDPKGLDLNGSLKYFQREINSNREEYDNIVKETNSLLDVIDPNKEDQTNLKEVSVRIIASAKLLESRVEDFKKILEDNMWVIVSNIITEVMSAAKEFVKTTLVGLKFAVKGVISGSKKMFRLPGW